MKRIIKTKIYILTILMISSCGKDESIILLPKSGMVNSGFEYGNFSGWEYDGNARVLAQLDTLAPWNGKFFALLSTGLDKEYEFGMIAQTFIIKKEHKLLSFRYAMIMEDFPACRAVQPQDYFRVTLTTSKKQEKMLLLLNAGIVAFKFGAQGSGTGDLLHVPETIFIDGYTTGWQEVTINLSEYQGEEISITFETIKPQGSKYSIAVMVDCVEMDKI